MIMIMMMMTIIITIIMYVMIIYGFVQNWCILQIAILIRIYYDQPSKTSVGHGGCRGFM